MYKVIEIFNSLDGEVNAWHQGCPTFFIRMAGCNCYCSYCDTKYSWNNPDAKEMSAGEIICELELMSWMKKVTITGGEPLQYNLKDLIIPLIQLGYRVSVETNGTIEVEDFWVVNKNVSFIIDIKLPSAQAQQPPQFEWIASMGMLPNTWIKFVVVNKDDFIEAIKVIKKWKLDNYNLAFSPVMGVDGALSIKALTEAVAKLRFPNSIINVQLHKLIGMR